MELVLDFGNTSKKIALFHDGKHVLLQSYSEISAEIMRDFFLSHPGITCSILSSVIHHPSSVEEVLKHSAQRVIFLDHDTPVPIKNCYRTPETLGRDRLAAVVGGAAEFPGEPVLVINAGTAITYDFIDSVGSYMGGGISPGMQMRFKALHTFTDKLPLVEYRELVEFPGTSTEDSILSGVVAGITGEMEAFGERMRSQYPEVKIILSGGDMIYFANRLKFNIFAIQNIVLTGLHQILMFNVNKTH
jgi:type III pantothenate kinase